ncbi:Alpha/Beta hydrolase fold [Tylopilus felleus]
MSIQYDHHGRFRVAGGVVPDAVTAYCTYGDPKNPCMVFPTCYGGKLDSQESSTSQVLDPRKYYIITFALFSNGEPAPYNGPYFPAVRAQYTVLTQKLGIKKAFCVIGFSMVVYPEFVERFIAICGFLEGPKAALTASKDFDNGYYAPTWPTYSDLHAFLREEWEAGFLNGWDANDLLTLPHTWQVGDVSTIRDNGDLGKSLSAITAKGLIIPCKTDLYFPPEDSENEMLYLKHAKLVVIPSSWGHMAGGGANAEDDKFLQSEIKKFLEEL